MANPLDDVDKRVASLLNLVQAGTIKAAELSWLDFKEKWGDIKGDEREKVEFFKDVCALANVGQDAYMIFGADSSGRVVQSARFTDCGYDDPAMLQELVKSWVSPSLVVEVGHLAQKVGGCELSYLYIKATHNRPHLVKRWINLKSGKTDTATENAFFWRVGSSTHGANDRAYPDRIRWDSMYYDRPGSFSALRTRRWEGEIVSDAPSQMEGKRGFSVPFQVSNLGTLQTAIVEMRVDGTVALADGPSVPLGSSMVLSFTNKKNESDRLPLHVPPGESQPFHALLHVDPDLIKVACGSGKRRFELTVVLTDIHDGVYPDDVKWDEPAQ